MEERSKMKVDTRNEDTQEQYQGAYNYQSQNQYQSYYSGEIEWRIILGRQRSFRSSVFYPAICNSHTLRRIRQLYLYDFLRGKSCRGKQLARAISFAKYQLPYRSKPSGCLDSCGGVIFASPHYSLHSHFLCWVCSSGNG